MWVSYREIRAHLHVLPVRGLQRPRLGAVMTATLPLTAPQIAARESVAAAEEGYMLACRLIGIGIPTICFLPAPKGAVDEQGRPKEYWLPSEYQKFTADLRHLSRWNASSHSLALVSGHGVDGIDVDAKYGASVDDEYARLRDNGVQVWARTRTPSDGAHNYILSSGLRSTNNPTTTGIDTRMGDREGKGRGLLYLPGTRRPKYGGLGYTWVQHFDIPALAVAMADPDLRAAQSLAVRAYMAEIGVSPEREGVPEITPCSPEDISPMMIDTRLRAELAELPPWTGGQGGKANDRSARFMHLVGACLRTHLTQGQALTLLTEWNADPELGNGKCTGRLPEQVATCWALAFADNEAWKAAKASEAATGKDVPRTSLAPVQGVGSLEDVQGPAQEDVAPTPSTWLPVDLGSILDGTYVPELPTIARRSDGLGLFYPGRTHSIYGPSESGKSLVAQAVAVEVLQDGGTVLYLDFESDGASIVQRLRSLGATDSAIRERLAYVRPDSGLTASMDLRAYQDVLSQTFTLAIIDGVTEAMALVRSDSHGTPEADASTFDRRLPRLIATRTGAAVIAIDHVVKDTLSQGRHAIGSVHKLNALTGAAFRAQATTLPGKGRKGAVDLQVTKDRPGSLRPSCGPMGPHQSQLAATFHFDATGEDGQTTVRVEAPSAEGEDRGPFRPTVLMERASKHLEDAGEDVSQGVITAAIGGRKQYVIAALDVLETEGYVHVFRRGKATLHRSLKPYRQVRDSLSDCYVQTDSDSD